MVLIIWLGLLMGLVLLPRIQTFITDYLEQFPLDEDWAFLNVILLLLPFAFLILVLYGAFKWIGKA